MHLEESEAIKRELERQPLGNLIMFVDICVLNLILKSVRLAFGSSQVRFPGPASFISFHLLMKG